MIDLLLVLANESLSFDTQYWCFPDECYDFGKPVHVAAVVRPQDYCGEGEYPSYYDYGCAVLDKDLAVARLMPDSASVEGTMGVIEHELLHLRLWKEYKDATHKRFNEYGVQPVLHLRG